MFCPNCGTQNDENNAKCQKCGFSIKGALAPKFKGTMLMMNAPPAMAQRFPSPGGGTGPASRPVPAPVAAPAGVPKKPLAKMTMIGVAPPSPGAVAPPAARQELKTGTLGQGSVPPLKPSVPPGQGAVAAPRPSAPPVARQGASRPPVNPFGGTMLMGAVADGPVGAQPSSVDGKPLQALSLAQPDGASPTSANPAVIPHQNQASALSTTTPSVAPPELANPQKLPSEMATVASAVSPAIVPDPVALAAPRPAPLVASPEWDKQAIENAADPLAVVRGSQSSSLDSLAIAPRPNGPSFVIRLLLGILTLGIYPLVLWLAQKRQSNGN